MRWSGDAAQPPGLFRLKEPVRPAGPPWLETSVRPQDAQPTRAPRLRSATTPSQTRRALCFPSTTAMAASSSGDFATHQMQLRRQRRFCGSDALRNNGALRDGGAFRNGVFCIQGLCQALYHERVLFFPVLAQICGCERLIFRKQKALYKRPGQKRGTCQSVQKTPSARRKIVHNRKFVPELPKSGHVFGKAGTKGRARTKRSRKMRTESKGPEARARPANERLQEAEEVPRIGGCGERKLENVLRSKSESSLWQRKLNDHTDRAVTQAEYRTG